MVSRYSPDDDGVVEVIETADYIKPVGRLVYGHRSCPVCGGDIYGMPGSPDANCGECGYKDPCCSDY